MKSKAVKVGVALLVIALLIYAVRLYVYSRINDESAFSKGSRTDVQENGK